MAVDNENLGLAIPFWDVFYAQVNQYLNANRTASNTITLPYQGKEHRVISFGKNYSVNLEDVTTPIPLTESMLQPLLHKLFNVFGGTASAAGR